MADSDSDWRRWGETDPYFGVCTEERFRRSSIDDNREAFFRSGEAHVEERLAAAARHYGQFRRGSALEFGCGVGRLTLPLAATFGHVTALDIAPAMLAEAHRNAQARGLNNISFRQSDDALSNADGSYDFVLSCIVLQHIPIRRGMRIIQAMLEKTAPGGIVALQLCSGRHDSLASRTRFWIQRNVPGVHELVNMKRGRPRTEPFMEMNVYSVDRVIALAEAANFGACVVNSFTESRFRSTELLMRRN